MNPDLPELKWDGYCWEGEVVLPSWRGFQTRRGPYASVSSEAPSDGTALIRFDTGDSGQVPPTEAQITAYRWLIEHEAEVATAVLNALFAEYPRLREEYVDCFGDPEDIQIASQTAPPLSNPDQLRLVMGLYAVFVLPIAKDGVGYVGFEFGCVFEGEHGLGVMTHKARVVAIGAADTSFNDHIARRDATGT
jgi:hypothetical protein